VESLAPPARIGLATFGLGKLGKNGKNKSHFQHLRQLAGVSDGEATTLYDGENRLATGCDGQHVGNRSLYVSAHRSGPSKACGFTTGPASVLLPLPAQRDGDMVSIRCSPSTQFCECSGFPLDVASEVWSNLELGAIHRPYSELQRVGAQRE
jgi:hypothetical protein